MSEQKAISSIAYNAVDLLESARERMNWIGSLSWAVHKSLSTNHVTHAARLAEAAQFLAEDFHNILDSEVDIFNKKLDTLDVRG